MLKTYTVTYVRLSDVMEYMGYAELMDDAGDIFSSVTWGDSMNTIVLTEDVLDMLYYWIDGTHDSVWTSEEAEAFTEKAHQLVSNHLYVDMES